MADEASPRSVTLNKRTLIVLALLILALLVLLSVAGAPSDPNIPPYLSYFISSSDVSTEGNQTASSIFHASQNTERLLSPPPQDWIQAQFENALSEVNQTYNPPSLWRSCGPKTYYFPNISIIFTGTPKTGCSNWIEALLRAEGVLKEQLDPTKVSRVHGMSTSFRMSIINKLYDETTLRQTFSFTAVRNPWTRLVSGYRDKLSAEITQGRPKKSIRLQILKNLRGLNESVVLSQNLHPTFREFAVWLIKHNGNVNVHFKPQYKVLCIPSVRYDYVLPVEYSRIMSSEVFSKIDKNVSLLESYDKSSDPRLQKSTVIAKEWLSQIDPNIIDSLYKIFKADFLLLNYSNFTHPDFPLPLYDNYAQL